MAKRQKEHAKRMRAQLLEELGGRCQHCPATEDLTFDHTHPEDKVGYSEAKGSDSRMYEYRRLAKLGRIQLLCRACNSRKGRMSQSDIDEMIANERTSYASSVV